MSIKTLAARLQYNGGDQLGRIKKNKLRSLEAALKNSYNARQIKTPNKGLWYGLINLENLKSDYDRKTISINFDSGLEAGDVFEVLDDHTHWMIYLPDLVETAYLRAEIIRCRYTIEIDGEEYWIYFQGPTETDIPWYIKNGVNFNELNLSGTIYIKKDEKTSHFFKRFTHIKLDGHMWEVQVTDRITVPGIMELEVQEYYDNTIAELPEVIKENDVSQIIGKTTVKQNSVNGYEIDSKFYDRSFYWEVSGNPRVELDEVLADGHICKVKVHPGAIRTYRVSYTNGKDGYFTDVTIDWSKQIIIGPSEVYPYDTKTYSMKIPGRFWIETDLAKLVTKDDRSCSIEITTGKKGKFTLYFKPDDGGDVVELPITIKSF